jgi:hypothetical protein
MMAKKPAAKAEKTKKTKTTAERVAEPVKKAGKVIRDGAAQAMANTAAINAKVIDHAEANAREAFATMRKVANAKSVQEVIKAQGDFVKEQSARSAAHVREVGELIASFGRHALDTMRGK